MNLNFDVHLCVRNNSASLQLTFDCFRECEDSGFDFTYYIFENDSTDDTLDQVATFLCNRKGFVSSCTFRNLSWDHVVDKSRVTNMALYRNRCKKMCTSPSQYSLVVDTNIRFSPSTLHELLLPFSSDNALIATFPFAVDVFGTYYDTYALKTYNHSKSLPLSTGSYIPVLSAFGGLGLYKSSHYLASLYGTPEDEKDNEHVFLHSQLSPLGSLIICKNSHCIWYS